MKNQCLIINDNNDLYDILINGNLLFKSPLRSGDSVIINPSQRLVAISGGINTPAIYELKNNGTKDKIFAVDNIFYFYAWYNLYKVVISVCLFFYVRS